MFHEIKTQKDIEEFIERSNSLHDGYIIAVHYSNNGITKMNGGGYHFKPEKTKLSIQVLVTSIYDTIIEIEFENIQEWQIKDNQWEITDTAVLFDEKNRILWLDDEYINPEDTKMGSYVIAGSMKWRIIE